MDSTKLEKYLETINWTFKVSKFKIGQVVADFHSEMERGLRGKKSSLKMLPAYVDIASGKEKGKFIALDLGGTNFRVLQVSLDGKRQSKIEHVGKYVIPNAVMHGTGEQLFNFIAQSILKFVEKYKIVVGKGRKLGFTFSFPVKQNGITNGVLINWTKGFSATGVVKKNVVRLLQDSLKEYDLDKIGIVALANDTVGTLAAKSYEDANCDMGVIFGTGTNACYRDTMCNIKKMRGHSSSRQRMIVNIEWGNFDKLSQNNFDKKLDRATNNPGRQIMEKMISGMYLGEIGRLVITDMIRKKLIFRECKAKFSRGDFKTNHMSLIEADHSSDLSKIEDYLESVGILNTSLEEREILKKVCRVISTRAARISAAAILAVVTHMDPDISGNHTVAIDGTLYERYPRFRRVIVNLLEDMLEEKGRRIKLVQARDGSGIGVAIVAAVATARR